MPTGRRWKGQVPTCCLCICACVGTPTGVATHRQEGRLCRDRAYPGATPMPLTWDMNWHTRLMAVLGTWDISILVASTSFSMEPLFPWMLQQIKVEVRESGPQLEFRRWVPRHRGKQKRLTCLATELWLVCSVPGETGPT